MTASSARSRAHRTLLFEYLLGVGLLVTGLIGMTLMQARALLLHQLEGGAGETLALWLGSPGYEADDARSLSPSLRVCGDGLERPVELACWREQLAALLPADAAPTRMQRSSHRLRVDGREREVTVSGGAGTSGSGGLVVADARSGEVLWRVDGGARAGYSQETAVLGHPRMLDELSPRIAVLDGDLDGFIDRVYAGDRAGRLWRVDLAGVPGGLPAVADNVRHDDPALWSATPLFTTATYGTAFAPASLQERGLTAGADVVQAGDADGRYDAVLIGSDSADAIEGRNWLYMIKDRAVVSGLPPDRLREHAELVDLSPGCDDCAAGGSLRDGWRIAMSRPGEQLSARPVTAAGNVFFTTRAPSDGTCGGRRALYVLALRDARALVTANAAGEDPDAHDIMDIVENASGAPPCRVARATGR